MQFNLDYNASAYTIRSYQAGQVTVIVPRWRGNDAMEQGDMDADGGAPHQETLQHSFIIRPQELIREWPPQCAAELSSHHFEVVTRSRPEIVILGVGPTLQWPASEVMASLTDEGIGIEVMDTGAACRTYNILMHEGREVSAAFLMK